MVVWKGTPFDCGISDSRRSISKYPHKLNNLEECRPNPHLTQEEYEEYRKGYDWNERYNKRHY